MIRKSERRIKQLLGFVVIALFCLDAGLSQISASQRSGSRNSGRRSSGSSSWRRTVSGPRVTGRRSVPPYLGYRRHYSRRYFGIHRDYRWRRPWLATGFWLGFNYPPRYYRYYEPYDNSCVVSNDTDFEFIVNVSGTPGLRVPPGGWIYVPCGSQVSIREVENRISRRIVPRDGLIIHGGINDLVID